MGDLTKAADSVKRHLPYLRRYARALTGDQPTGDSIAMEALKSYLQSPQAGQPAVKVHMFAAFHAVWQKAGKPTGDGETGLKARAQHHLAKLTPNSREALLLNSVEEFSVADVAEILGITLETAEVLLATAKQDLKNSVLGRVMIIEDEAIIALDLQTIVTSLGHSVTGVARTQTAAAKLAAERKPDLVLADIQLADDSSGIDAVRDILGSGIDCPVIFITAYPERLLTGERPEPAFLISKPYLEDQVQSAVSQAMFFASTETLTSN